MMMNRAEEVYFHTFFNPALDNSDWSASCSNSFTCAESQESSGISNDTLIHKNSRIIIFPLQKTKPYMDPITSYNKTNEMH